MPPRRTYSRSDIERLKARVDIVDAAHRLAIRLSTANDDDHSGLCPIHNDRNPSLGVSRSKQVFHCFGCNAKGDVITLVQQVAKVSFPEAVRFLEEWGDAPYETHQSTFAEGSFPFEPRFSEGERERQPVV
ncbi:MAG TPA: CHC2 zinc finger domain-containing protein [Vicinamibacterales bacterium]|nr:CHC2 zinc finger domain-containing protein [Vicinamibacterales bacterium]